MNANPSSAVSVRQGESVSLITGQVAVAPAKAITENDHLLGTNNMCTLAWVFAVMIADSRDARSDWTVDDMIASEFAPAKVHAVRTTESCSWCYRTATFRITTPGSEWDMVDFGCSAHTRIHYPTETPIRGEWMLKHNDLDQLADWFSLSASNWHQS